MEKMSPSKSSTPVYVAYATLISALENLRAHGIPATGIIDKSLWDTQSGAVQGQLLVAFRFLGLIDEQNRVQTALLPLVRASIEERKALLKRIVEDKYRDVISLGLTTISQGQLEEAFRKYPISGSTLDRAVRFFVKACQESGIEISSRVAERVRSIPAGSGRRRKAAASAKSHVEDDGPGRKESNVSDREDKLLAKFPEFDPGWPDDLKTKWFEGFERLMKSSLGN